MTYVIPLAILLAAGLIWPVCALLSRIDTEPAAWNWTRIFDISAIILLPLLLFAPRDWPEIARWSPAIIIWYLAGRRDQQGIRTKQNASK